MHVFKNLAAIHFNWRDFINRDMSMSLLLSLLIISLSLSLSLSADSDDDGRGWFLLIFDFLPTWDIDGEGLFRSFSGSCLLQWSTAILHLPSRVNCQLSIVKYHLNLSKLKLKHFLVFAFDIRIRINIEQKLYSNIFNF